MKIAYITPEYVTENYFSGGLANYIFRVASYLAQQGHSIHVVTLSNEPSSTFKHNGVTVHRLRSSSKSQTDALSALHPYQQWIRQSFAFTSKLRSIHRRVGLDLVQVSQYNALGLGVFALSPVPVIMRTSSYQPNIDEKTFEPPEKMSEHVMVALEKLQIKTAPHIIAPSNTLKKIIQRDFPQRSIRVIPSPFYMEIQNTDPSVFDKQIGNKPYLLYVGRYQLHKGFHILLDALKDIFPACPDLTAVFVGEDRPTRLGPSMKRLALDSLPAYRNRLLFIEQLPHNQLYPIMQNARLITLPSLSDNLPNTLLESMACARPVIGTIGASFDEVITDGQDGFLVPMEDPVALADKVIQSWNRSDLDRIGSAARDKIREFAPERSIAELLDYYQDVIDDKA